jgi:hypothetical protein
MCHSDQIRKVLSIFVITVASVLVSNRVAAQPITPARNASIMVNATVTSSPVRVNLSWPAWPAATQYDIYRKLRSSTNWSTLTSITNNAGSATRYQDASISSNTEYEYKVIRTSPGKVASGYIASGFNVTPDVLIGNADHYMGKIILVTWEGIADDLSLELATLRSDLQADGWVVLEHNLDGTESVADVHAQIVADYNNDPSHVKAVYLLGHVPVPHSGNMAPDGHGDHWGAWPCDGYYGEMNGTWTDNTVNVTSSQNTRNYNVPGDGKFDQNIFPSAVELQVGRLDLSELDNAFFWSSEASPPLDEIERMQLYMDRAHAFKTKQFIPDFEGVVFDNFRDTLYDLRFAANGYRNIGALVGYNSPAYTDETPTSNAACTSTNIYSFGTYITGANKLWSYACGGGSWGCAADVGSTDNLAQGLMDMNSVFNMSYGSYFGDWDHDGSFLRSPLVKGNALTNVWAGVPNWWFHTMGMGEPIGRSVLMTMNNQGGSPLYTPQSGDGNTANWTQTALMGDPTLRMVMVAPPSNVQVTNVSNKAAFSWTASPDIAIGSGNGYNVYAFNDLGEPVKINSALITSTSFASTLDFSYTERYMVRAVKLQTSKTGTYWNLSLGAFNAMTSLEAKVFLGGPYNAGTGTMNDELRQHDQLPTNEPYSALDPATNDVWQPVGGGGEIADASVFTNSGPNAIVDWVLLEVRSTATFNVIASQCALLQRDGDVVGTDGHSPVRFNLTSGSYHVSIRHRNHLGCMSSSTYTFNGSTVSVDFTNPSTSTWGTNAQKTIGSVHALWPANSYFADHVVKYTGANNDRDAILNRLGGTDPNATVTNIYAVEDVNMDNVVKYTGAGNDRDIILQTIGASDPTAVRVEQLP